MTAPTQQSQQFWLDTVLGWAEARLPGPQFDECKAALLQPGTASYTSLINDLERMAAKFRKAVQVAYDAPIERSIYGDVVERLTTVIHRAQQAEQQAWLAAQSAESDVAQAASALLAACVAEQEAIEAYDSRKFTMRGDEWLKLVNARRATGLARVQATAAYAAALAANSKR